MPTDTKEGDWWNPSIKTIYDPCPNGYRIPKNGTYGNASSDNPSEIGSDWSGNELTSGMIWTNSFFPASGHRYRSSGKLGNVGSAGYYWMSVPISEYNGSFVAINFEYIDPNASYPRAYGIPIRCIKEQ